MAELFDEAVDWLKIPSISAGERNEAALREAAEWAVKRVLDAGGTCELVETAGRRAAGRRRAARVARDDAPTVMIYGHYDVQDPGDPADWDLARVRADGPRRAALRPRRDRRQGQLPPAAARRVRDGRRAATLPVHVRVLIEGAEETGSDDVGEWVRADDRGADAVIVFDSGMIDADTPALTLATRGMVFAHIEVRTGTQTAHSGMYGGAALNAFHALHKVAERGPARARTGGCPSRCARASSRRRRPSSRAGGRCRTARASWPRSARGRPTPRPSRSSTSARPPSRRSTSTRSRAGRRARSSCRSPPPTCRCGSSAASARRRSRANLEALLRGALPEGAELIFSADRAEASAFDPETPALLAARRALARVGRQATPALCRTGGTLPILAAFAERGIPAIVSGFSLPDDALHAPERVLPARRARAGRAAARALYEELAGLQ